MERENHQVLLIDQKDVATRLSTEFKNKLFEAYKIDQIDNLASLKYNSAITGRVTNDNGIKYSLHLDVMVSQIPEPHISRAYQFYPRNIDDKIITTKTPIQVQKVSSPFILDNNKDAVLITGDSSNIDLVNKLKKEGFFVTVIYWHNCSVDLYQSADKFVPIHNDIDLHLIYILAKTS